MYQKYFTVCSSTIIMLSYLFDRPSRCIAIVYVDQKLFILGCGCDIGDVAEVDADTERSTHSYLLICCFELKGSTGDTVKLCRPE